MFAFVPNAVTSQGMLGLNLLAASQLSHHVLGAMATVVLMMVKLQLSPHSTDVAMRSRFLGITG